MLSLPRPKRSALKWKRVNETRAKKRDPFLLAQIEASQILPDHFKSLLRRDIPVTVLLDFFEDPGLDQRPTSDHDAVNLFRSITEGYT